MGSVEDYGIESVENGTILNKENSINIVFTEIGNRATSVKIVLMDLSGTELAAADVEPAILKGMGMPLDLPQDLEDGLYYLTFSVMDGDILLFQEERYFYVVSGSYDIRSLETYPPGIRAGDEISARILLDSPAGSDPWLRWTLADEVLQEGFLSETGTECSFSVPETGGVYSLKVELFPVAPQADHISSVYRQSDLFVAEGEGEDLPWKFIEDRTYLFFIEFNDDLVNRMNPYDSPRIVGTPVPQSQGHYSGSSFSESDGLVFGSSALSFPGDPAVKDFHMSLAFSNKTLPVKGSYNIIRTGNAENYFSISYLAESRTIRTELFSGTTLFQSSVPADTVLTGESVFLEISRTGQTLIWKSQGNTILTEQGVEGNFPVKGNTVVGSDGTLSGMPLLWYTFSVSTDLSPEPLPETPPEEQISNTDYPVSREEGKAVYARTEELPGEINLMLSPGKGLASLVVFSEAHAPYEWTLRISDSNDALLYTLTSSEQAGTGSIQQDGDSEELRKMVISLNNDERGLFISSSSDSSMTGPLAFQKTLNINITPGPESSLDQIRDIRFYQD
ncbi:MAG: hypothetical protein PQJ58_09655 [Spirochaetales bacterium]|nr:hypothetical protein [Spirochaetales bacterium]